MHAKLHIRCRHLLNTLTIIVPSWVSGKLRTRFLVACRSGGRNITKACLCLAPLCTHRHHPRPRHPRQQRRVLECTLTICLRSSFPSSISRVCRTPGETRMTNSCCSGSRLALRLNPWGLVVRRRVTVRPSDMRDRDRISFSNLDHWTHWGRALISPFCHDDTACEDHSDSRTSPCT